MFKHLFISVVNGIAPTKIAHLRSDPWMDNEISLAIRDNLYNFSKLKSPVKHKIHCLLRNKV